MPEAGEAEPAVPYPVTPDGRYFVVQGRLWRKTNPALQEDTHRRLKVELMEARRAVAKAKKHDDAAGLSTARLGVDLAKRALGERGPVWWKDGAPDLNRYMVRNTPYAAWYEEANGSKNI